MKNLITRLNSLAVAAACLAAISVRCAATVVAYALPNCYAVSSQYTLTANSTSIPIIDGANTSTTLGSFSYDSGHFVNYDYCHFSATANAAISISITASQTVTSCTVSPLAHNITAAFSGTNVTFTLPKPGYYIAKVNNLRDLVIAVDVLESGAPPSSGTNIFNVTASPYNANSTGSALATTAVQNALNDASAYGTAHPGTPGIVYVPAGVYVCANLLIDSNTWLYLAGGAVIRGTGRASDYSADFVKTSLSSPTGTLSNVSGTYWIHTYVSPTDPHTSSTHNYTNIKIYGRGTLDGNGHIMRQATTPFLMTLFIPFHCSGVTVDGVVLRDGTYWSCQPTRCDTVSITNTKHFNENNADWEDDAIDIVECQNVSGQNIVAVSEDDTFSTKTWSQALGNSLGWPGLYENVDSVTFDTCVAWSRTGAFKVGDGMNKAQTNITYQNSFATCCGAGFKINNSSGGGGATNVYFINTDVENFWPRSGLSSQWLYVHGGQGPMSNFVFDKINLYGVGSAGSILQGADSTHLVSGVRFESVYRGSALGTSLAQINVTTISNYTNVSYLLEAEDPVLGIAPGGYYGVGTGAITDGGVPGTCVGSTYSRNWIAFENVDFGASGNFRTGINFRLATSNSGGAIEVYTTATTTPLYSGQWPATGGISGSTLIGTLSVASTGGFSTWATQALSIAAAGTTGTKHIYFVFKRPDGLSTANLNWVQLF